MYEIPLVPATQQHLTGRSKARYIAKRLKILGSVASKFAEACWPFVMTPAGLTFEPRHVASTLTLDKAALRFRLQTMGINEAVVRRQLAKRPLQLAS